MALLEPLSLLCKQAATEYCWHLQFRVLNFGEGMCSRKAWLEATNSSGSQQLSSEPQQPANQQRAPASPQTAAPPRSSRRTRAPPPRRRRRRRRRAPLLAALCMPLRLRCGARPCVPRAKGMRGNGGLMVGAAGDGEGGALSSKHASTAKLTSNTAKASPAQRRVVLLPLCQRARRQPAAAGVLRAELDGRPLLRRHAR